jgi:hypothetical protein
MSFAALMCLMFCHLECPLNRTWRSKGFLKLLEASRPEMSSINVTLENICWTALSSKHVQNLHWKIRSGIVRMFAFS